MTYLLHVEQAPMFVAPPASRWTSLSYSTLHSLISAQPSSLSSFTLLLPRLLTVSPTGTPPPSSNTPPPRRHHERLCGFVHVRGLSSRTRSRPPHNGSGLRGSKPSLPALPTGLVLSLQCYSCLELETTSQCQPIQCPMSGVCFNSDMTVTLGSGESPAPRGCGGRFRELCPEASHSLGWAQVMAGDLLQPPSVSPSAS